MTDKAYDAAHKALENSGELSELRAFVKTSMADLDRRLVDLETSFKSLIGTESEARFDPANMGNRIRVRGVGGHGGQRDDA